MAPNLNQDPNLLTQQLILAAIFALNGTSDPSHPIPTIPEWTGPSATAVWVQSLLYASLACSLFAALGAVMGKQWLSHYRSVGERGTVERRGIDRQLKMHGLQAWHFRAVLEVIPLILQASLLLFGLGLSAYVYDQQHTVAALAIIVNGLGAIFYFTVIALSLLVPDCPFYTPLSAILQRLFRSCAVTCKSIPGRIVRLALFVTLPALVSIRRLFSVLRPWSHDVNTTPGDEETRISLSVRHPVGNYINVNSITAEVPEGDRAAIFAIGWILEATTDPMVFLDTMRLSLDIQWSSDTIRALPIEVLDRLLLQIYACFQPVPSDPKTLLLEDSNKNTVATLASVFVFIYWEKIVTEHDQVTHWAATLGPQFAEDSAFDWALVRCQYNEGVDWRTLDLLRHTLYHAEFLKFSPLSTTIFSLYPAKRLIPPTSLEVLRARTAFLLAQHVACRVSNPQSLWGHRKSSIKLSCEQTEGVTSPDSLALTILACTTAIGCELPQCLRDAVSMRMRWVEC